MEEELQETFEGKGDCHLECKQKGFKRLKFKHLSGLKVPKFQLDEGSKEAREFIGPVRVVLVTTPKRQYRYKTWGAAFIVLGLFLVGATVIPIFFYCMSIALEPMTSLHILLFTAGLLTPVAFFTMNTHNGSSSFLKPAHKKTDYFVLKIVSITLIITATVFSTMSPTMKFTDFKNFTPHGVLGSVAVLLSFFDVCAFFCLPCDPKRIWPRFALVLCIPSFTLSSACFILGILQPRIRQWLPLPSIVYFLITFCVIYTIIAVWNPFTNVKCRGH